MCVHTTHAHTHATVRLRRSEGNFWELILSFYHVLPGNQTQVIGFWDKCSYLLSLFTGPGIFPHPHFSVHIQVTRTVSPWLSVPSFTSLTYGTRSICPSLTLPS